MRNILIIFLSLAILCVAIIGSMFIFGAASWQQSVEYLAKAIAALALLGGCSAAIKLMLAGSRNREEHSSQDR
jgi:type IV secretory pathway VirB2 component (pilin)